MRILLFGATGSAGGSVLRACLSAPPVTEVRAITRRPVPLDHPKLRNDARLVAAIRPFYRLLRPFRGLYIAGENLGRSMLQATAENMRRRIIENSEIRDIADRAAAFRARGER